MSYSKASDLLRLAMRAASYGGVSLQEIGAEFECCPRTAQRMTDALERTFPATERIVGEDRRARWRLPSRAVAPLLSPTADELVALGLAVGRMERSDAATEAIALRALAEKVHALIPKERGLSLTIDEEALLEAMGHAARPGPKPAANREVDAAIATSLKSSSRLTIAYKTRGGDAPDEREVEPYGLLLGVRRYLVARDVAKDDRLRHYRVEDITAAQVLPRAFQLPDGFDLARYARRAFGSYQRDDERGEVVWRFAPRAAEHVRRFLFHPDQIVQQHEDGTITVRFQASGHLEMCWHLYSWGDAVEVLEPPELANLVNPYRRSDFDALP